MKNKIDFTGLSLFLRSLTYEDVESDRRKDNVKLIACKTMLSVERFKLDVDKFPFGKIIKYGEPFLIDALGNDLSIVILSRRKYKLPDGRAIHGKFVTTIIDDCRQLYGSPVNGYWKIPSEYISV